jgi:hypothetical protein
MGASFSDGPHRMAGSGSRARALVVTAEGGSLLWFTKAASIGANSRIASALLTLAYDS